MTQQRHRARDRTNRSHSKYSKIESETDRWGIIPLPPLPSGPPGSYLESCAGSKLTAVTESEVVLSSCPVCESLFEPQQTPPTRGRPRKYCSNRCTKKALRDSKAKACESSGCARPQRAKNLCSTHYNAMFHKGSQQRWPANPDERRRRLRIRTQRRRALETDPDADLIDRDVVGERDEWVCGICGRDVDKSLAYPEPKSPSLDHVTPLARGGRHILANVRISHLDCNVKRGCPAEF
jgi:hypothetical protein